MKTIGRIEGSPVTLGHLLTHTAGFEDWFFGAMAAPGQPVESLDDYFTRHPPHRAMPAGFQISYSNHGMALAGYVVERAAGIPLQQATVALVPLLAYWNLLGFRYLIPSVQRERRAPIPSTHPVDIRTVLA